MRRVHEPRDVDGARPFEVRVERAPDATDVLAGGIALRLDERDAVLEFPQRQVRGGVKQAVDGRPVPEECLRPELPLFAEIQRITGYPEGSADTRARRWRRP